MEPTCSISSRALRNNPLTLDYGVGSAAQTACFPGQRFPPKIVAKWVKHTWMDAPQRALGEVIEMFRKAGLLAALSLMLIAPAYAESWGLRPIDPVRNDMPKQGSMEPVTIEIPKQPPMEPVNVEIPKAEPIPPVNSKLSKKARAKELTGSKIDDHDDGSRTIYHDDGTSNRLYPDGSVDHTNSAGETFHWPLSPNSRFYDYPNGARLQVWGPDGKIDAIRWFGPSNNQSMFPRRGTDTTVTSDGWMHTEGKYGRWIVDPSGSQIWQNRGGTLTNRIDADGNVEVFRRPR
jgi:hypothetical protein